MNPIPAPSEHPSPAAALPQALRAHWLQLSARERSALLLALLVLAAALCWWVLLAPALAVLRQAPAQHRALQDQHQAMQGLQAQARLWQQQAPPDSAESLRLLRAGVEQLLGASARLDVRGNQATLQLDKASPAALSRWLVQARTEAHMQVLEAHLSRPAPSASVAMPAQWSGTLVLSWPAP